MKRLFTDEDRAMMREALELARRGSGRVAPNPLVGALLVDGKGRRLAEGSHLRFGGPHAESHLLSRLAGDVSIPRDATLYLTLEPCAHQGKTPPCVDALIASGIRRFVIAALDPDPRTAGRGVRALRAAGRDVRVGLLRSEAREMNEPFFLAQEKGRARVILKIASTLDGRVADFAGRSRWITHPTSRLEVARLREACDAIVVGSGTVKTDDPRLRARSVLRAPSRIVISSRLDFDPECRLARIWRMERRGRVVRGAERGALPLIEGNWIGGREDGRAPTRWVRRPRLIVATAHPKEERLAAFRNRGWEIWPHPDRFGRVDLRALARRAKEEGLCDLLVEPGPRLASGFLQSGPVDRILLFLAPAVLGGDRGWTADLTPLPLRRIIRGAILEPPRVHGSDIQITVAGSRGSARRACRALRL